MDIGMNGQTGCRAKGRALAESKQEWVIICLAFAEELSLHLQLAMFMYFTPQNICLEKEHMVLRKRNPESLQLRVSFYKIRFFS